jgi:cytochrome oxidase assembly protein ShyY1
MVLVALPILIGFGVWQLQRAEWKAGLLKTMEANARAPLLDLGAGPIPANLQFRRIRIDAACAPGLTTPRAGRSLEGRAGFSHLASCIAGGQPFQLDAGWSARPQPVMLPARKGSVSGVLVPLPAGWRLVSATATAPLVPSAPPGPDTISNNHLSYAVQWFSFAAILAVIYGLWLRRWLATNRPRA